jgi:hypothetical protein
VAQVDRRQELAGLSRSIEDFCERIRTGLRQATFDQKRKLVELLIDRVIVSDGEVEIRYVMPTCKNSEQIRFCHLQLDYRTGSPANQTTPSPDAGIEELPNRRSGDRWHRISREGQKAAIQNRPTWWQQGHYARALARCARCLVWESLQNCSHSINFHLTSNLHRSQKV